MKAGADFILWLDSDVVFPSTLMLDLMDDMEGRDIVTGVYHMRRPPFRPVLWKKLKMGIVPQDNEDENFLKFERYFPTSSVKDQTNRHNFERFLFENIDCEDALNVYVDIYYIGEVDYDGDAYGTIPVYTSDENEIGCKYFPTKADKKALEAAK